MDTTLIYSTLFEIYFNGAFVGVNFRDSDGRRRSTVGELIREAFQKAPRGETPIFVTVEWESSEGWSSVATDYAKTKVIRDTKYRLEFFNRDLKSELPHKCALVWDPIGGERTEAVMYSTENDYVILLLGARNSGKTILVNDITSYLGHVDYGSFMRCGTCNVAAPSQPKTLDCDLRVHEFEGNLFSFVDTPGIVDFRCIENDRHHMDTVLRALTVFPHVNAVCFTFNPFAEDREEVIRHQMHFLLANLPKEIATNVFFLVNKSFSKRTANVLLLLKSVFEETEIPFCTQKVFFFENVASLAWSLQKEGILDERVREDYGRRWMQSRDSLLKFLEAAKASPPISPHFFEFVRQNRRKLNAAVAKILAIQSKSAENRSAVEKEGESLEEKCIECIHFLSRHSAIADANAFLPRYVDFLQKKEISCGHLSRFEEKFELENRLWEEAKASNDWDISFFVSKRSHFGSKDRLNSQESVFSSESSAGMKVD